MLTGNDILDGVKKDLNDRNFTRWLEADLVMYLNAAILQVGLVRPDALGVTEVMQLAAGTRQALPAGGMRLLDVVRNMGTDGATPGMPVKDCERGMLDASNSAWHTETGVAEVYNYCFDAISPKTFYVTPPADGTSYVEIVHSKAPTRFTTATLDNDMPIDDVYQGPVHDWCMHRAFAVDISSPASQALSRSHEQSFYQAFGLKTRADLAVSPNSRKTDELQ